MIPEEYIDYCYGRIKKPIQEITNIWVRKIERNWRAEQDADCVKSILV